MASPSTIARPVAAPALPVAPVEYSPHFQTQFTNALRLYFNQLSNAVGIVIARTNNQFGSSSHTATTVVLELTDGLALIDTTAGNVAVTLPDASLVNGYSFTVKRITAGVNTLTVTATAGNIDGAASSLLATQYLARTFRSDGTNYWIV